MKFVTLPGAFFSKQIITSRHIPECCVSGRGAIHCARGDVGNIGRGSPTSWVCEGAMYCAPTGCPVVAPWARGLVDLGGDAADGVGGAEGVEVEGGDSGGDEFAALGDGPVYAYGCGVGVG